MFDCPQPLLLSAGEPAGIGYDLCVLLAAELIAQQVVICADVTVLAARAKQLGQTFKYQIYDLGLPYLEQKSASTLLVLPIHYPQSVIAGQLNDENSPTVLAMLQLVYQYVVAGHFAALVTAPIHKAILNTVDPRFLGHTEFFAQQSHPVVQSVMLLASPDLRVALVTTHLPLSAVSAAITPVQLKAVLTTLHTALQRDFALTTPRIGVCGLNPHAGEGGVLGTEEQQVINPVLQQLRDAGMRVSEALPADTLFTPRMRAQFDVIVAMYHDQGLAVLKSQGFDEAVNITLGLPIIRTSVDHGTALSLAGTGQIETGSLLQAIVQARWLSENRTRFMQESQNATG